MNEQQFEEWWWDGGSDEAIEKYDEQITEAEIKAQPSYRYNRNRDNAYIEAVWARAHKEMVSDRNCEHKATITIRREVRDLEGFMRMEEVKWCRKCGSLWEWDWEGGVRIPRWIKPTDRQNKE